MSDLRLFAERVEAKYKIKTLQIYIHRDEGHKATAEDIAAGLADTPGEFICNHHAHIVFDWMDHATGKSIKINKQQTSELQTLLAETLGMERGVSSDKKHLNALQYKAQVASQRISEQQHTIAALRQQEQRAAAELAKVEAPLAEILDATQKNIIAPMAIGRWDALQLAANPEKIRQKTAIVEENYKQAIRAVQNSEKEKAALKRQNAKLEKRLEAEHRLPVILPLAEKIPQLTTELVKSLAEGQRVSLWFDDPKRGKIYADMWWDEEKKRVLYAPNQEWENGKKLQEIRQQRAQVQEKNIAHHRGVR
jgi:hypothetical protein